MEKIKLYTFYSEDYLPLKKRFSNSLRDDYEVHFILYDKKLSGNNTGGGLQTWIFKTEKIIEVIKKHKNEIVIFSDIDIQFFDKTENLIRELINGSDIVFQGEHKFTKVNIGFIVFYSNDRVLKFWNDVLDMVINENIWDQEAVNKLLISSKDIKWGYLPSIFWNWYMSPCWRSIVLHHAIGAGDIRVKLMQMKIVSFVYHLKFLNNYDALYKFARIFYRKYKNYLMNTGC